MRAQMVDRAEAYRCSSAAAHCGLRVDTVLAKEGPWAQGIADVQDWSKWLAEADEPEKLDILRRNIDKGLPCGSEEFIERLSKKSGRSLKFLPRGRPRKIPDKGLRPLLPPFYECPLFKRRFA